MDPQKFVHDLRTQFFAQAHSPLEDLPEESSERLMLLCRLYADLLVASLEHESPEETVEVLRAFMKVICAWMIDGFGMDENTFGKGDYSLACIVTKPKMVKRSEKFFSIWAISPNAWMMTSKWRTRSTASASCVPTGCATTG